MPFITHWLIRARMALAAWLVGRHAVVLNATIEGGVRFDDDRHVMLRGNTFEATLTGTVA